MRWHGFSPHKSGPVTRRVQQVLLQVLQEALSSGVKMVKIPGAKAQQQNVVPLEREPLDQARQRPRLSEVVGAIEHDARAAADQLA